MVNVADTFARGNSTTSLGSTTTGNVPWEMTRGGWGITSQAAYIVSGVGTNLAVVETGDANGRLGTNIVVQFGQSAMGLSFRLTDADNCYFMECSTSGGTTAKVYKRVAGVNTLVAQSGSQDALGGNDLWEVLFNGTSIKVFRNSVEIISTTDSTFTTQTKHGLYSALASGSWSNQRLDNFSFVPSAAPAETSGDLSLARLQVAGGFESAGEISGAAGLSRLQLGGVLAVTGGPLVEVGGPLSLRRLTVGGIVDAAIAQVATVALGGEAILSLNDVQVVQPEMALEILDPELDNAPTAITFVLSEAFPMREVDFYIDGVLVWTGESNFDGNVPATSIIVSEALGTQGEHTLTAQQSGARFAQATFTLLRAPEPWPRIVGEDAQAVEVPGALRPNGTRLWVFQDLLPVTSGGIGSYIMPMNPKEMTSPHLQRTLTSQHTTAISGQYHVWESAPHPKEWTFSGYAPTQEMHDKLQQYRDLNRRFYIIDHRNRAWKVILTDIKWEAQLYQNFDGEPTIWGHNYTAEALILDQTWTVPA